MYMHTLNTTAIGGLSLNVDFERAAFDNSKGSGALPRDARVVSGHLRGHGSLIGEYVCCLLEAGGMSRFQHSRIVFLHSSKASNNAEKTEPSSVHNSACGQARLNTSDQHESSYIRADCKVNGILLRWKEPRVCSLSGWE